MLNSLIYLLGDVTGGAVCVRRRGCWPAWMMVASVMVAGQAGRVIAMIGRARIGGRGGSRFGAVGVLVNALAQTEFWLKGA
jgi:hypothetical protein